MIFVSGVEEKTSGLEPSFLESGCLFPLLGWGWPFFSLLALPSRARGWPFGSGLARPRPKREEGQAWPKSKGRVKPDPTPKGMMGRLMIIFIITIISIQNIFINMPFPFLGRGLALPSPFLLGVEGWPFGSGLATSRPKGKGRVRLDPTPKGMMGRLMIIFIITIISIQNIFINMPFPFLGRGWPFLLPSFLG